MSNNSPDLPEYVYIHNVEYNTITESLPLKSDDLIVISINPLNDKALKVKLSTIKKNCYINGYGYYEP